jgi:two-component sensor histidine kinase
MKSGLAQEYRRAFGLFLFFFSVILTAGLLYPLYRAEQHRLKADIERKAEKYAVFCDFFLAQKAEQVAALGSRTQIRLKLVEFAEGKIDLDELRAYTQPRYLDGLSVYADIVCASRFDAAGRVIAHKGDHADLPFRQVRSGGTVLELSPDGRRLEVRQPIVEKGRLLGQDAAIFDIGQTAKEEDGVWYRLTQEPLGPQWQYAATTNPQIRVAFRCAPEAVSPKAEDFFLPFLPFALLLLVLVCAGAYLTIYRASRAILASLESLAERRALMVRETNHRVKNNLNIISSLIALHILDKGPSPILEDIQSKIALIGLIHDQLYRKADSETVDLKPYLEQLAKAIFVAHAPEGTYTALISGDEILVGDDECSGVGIIVSELILNALKYALSPGDGVRIHLSAGPDGWSLDFLNGGSRFPDDVDPATSAGFGMELIRRYTEQLKGRFVFERTPSTRFLFTFPA